MSSDLIVACRNGDIKQVDILLKLNENPNQVNERKNTPLYWASRNGYLEIVKLLLKAGADPKQANGWGDTPLRAALRNDYLDMIELLKSYENKISSLSLLCLRTIYRNQINTDNIPSMILEWDFYQ